MLDDVERLDQMINHLLEAARQEKSLVEVEVEDIELAELLRQCAETVRLRYRVAPEAIRFDLAPCAVRARRGDVEMVFRNLIDNAVKYAEAEPEVLVRLARKGDRAVVSICDNGPGIPPHLRRKIFGRFVRLGWELERKKPGTGLGLFIVRTLLSRLKGKIRIRDRAAGSGAVFEVELPAQVDVAGIVSATNDLSAIDMDRR
jgi:signal transduction histidine kinase